MNAFNNNMGGFNNPMGGGGFGGAGGFNRGGGMNRGAPGMGAMRGGRGGMMGGPGMNGMGMGGMPNMGMGGMPNMGMNMMGGMGKYPHVAAILFSMSLSLHFRGAALGSCGDLALCFALGVSSCLLSSLFLFLCFAWFLVCSDYWVVLYLVLYCVAANIYLCLQDSTACLTNSTQASSAVETRAVTAETKPAAEAATGSTLTERRELAASRFRRRFPQCEPQIDCLSVLLRCENIGTRTMSYPGSRTTAATGSY